MIEFNAFWKGIHEEFRKEGLIDPSVAAGYAEEHPVLTAAAVGVPLGMAAIGAKRAIQRAVAKPPAAPPASKGFSGKAMLGAGAIAAGLGYYAGKKRNE